MAFTISKQGEFDGIQELSAGDLEQVGGGLAAYTPGGPGTSNASSSDNIQDTFGSFWAALGWFSPHGIAAKIITAWWSANADLGAVTL